MVYIHRRPVVDPTLESFFGGLPKLFRCHWAPEAVRTGLEDECPKLPAAYVAHIDPGPDGFALIGHGRVLADRLSLTQAKVALKRYQR